jgi:hypothetical protein
MMPQSGAPGLLYDQKHVHSMDTCQLLPNPACGDEAGAQLQTGKQQSIKHTSRAQIGISL